MVSFGCPLHYGCVKWASPRRLHAAAARCPWTPASAGACPAMACLQIEEQPGEQRRPTSPMPALSRAL